MSMVEINNRTKAKVDTKMVKKISEVFLRERRRKGYDLSVAIVGDGEIRKLNNAYRKIDRPTDVLSFAGEGKFLGEIILGINQIKRQARELKRSAKDELAFILVHGLLHLAGLDDKTEKGRLNMIKEAEKFLTKHKCELSSHPASRLRGGIIAEQL